MSYTIQTLSGRKTIEANSAAQAVALHFSDMRDGWGSAIPSEVTVFSRKESSTFGPQEIIDAIAAEFGLKPYDHLNLI